jgi:hypothetical protein
MSTLTVITDDGIEAMARMLIGVSPPAAFTYIATGTGATAAASTDTTLGSENTTNGAARAVATCSFASPGTSQLTYNFVFTGSVTVREIAVFNAASGGDMLLRGVLSENRTFGDSEALEITITNTMVRV